MKKGDLVISQITDSEVRLYNLDSPCGNGGDDDYEIPHTKITNRDILILISDVIKKNHNYDEDDDSFQFQSYHVKVMKSDGSTGWAEVDWLKQLIE